MPEEKTLLNATVCYVVKDDEEVLLGIKTEKIGVGRWNAPGGGIEEGETERDAAVRELFEETGCGIIALPEDLEKVGIVDFQNTRSDGGSFICRVHFYIARKWTDEAQDTGEMIAHTWFHKDRLPLGQMMPADKFFVPQMFNGQKILAIVKYGPFQKELLGNVDVLEVNILPDD